MATLTGLRRAGPGRVLLELDGRPWRTVPDEVVIRCGLSAGTPLERPRLRELRRELRRAQALATATRALSSRDLSRRRLEERLRARGIAPEAGAEAVAALEEAGILDDERLARTRGGALAERGWGDAAVRARLEREGVSPDLVRRVIAELAPEEERAEAFVAGEADPRMAWKRLSRRGFAPGTIETVIGALDEDA
jgi:SOS response regulatory protein OraA/RecX